MKVTVRITLSIDGPNASITVEAKTAPRLTRSSDGEERSNSDFKFAHRELIATTNEMKNAKLPSTVRFFHDEDSSVEVFIISPKVGALRYFLDKLPTIDANESAIPVASAAL